MDRDPAIKWNIVGYLHLQFGAVKYLEARNGLFAADPGPLYIHTFGQQESASAPREGFRSLYSE